MFIQTEQTPNPQTLKFLPGRVVMKEGTAFFKNIDEVLKIALTKELKSIEWIKEVDSLKKAPSQESSQTTSAN